MSAYLTAQELAEMISCEPNSYSCMRRYLTKHGWPFEPNRRGFPQVSRNYYDKRMAGELGQSAQNGGDFEEPDFSMFKLA
ncbi:MAG TPA: DUF4224 domain-containing protein [Noviherbaspirillum sp.]|jgi:hypothetical protein|uniref:DUF4224 domain-containing protein n=1 Tax=Noviherbaspirillum sp. TaxID=1926288 RepID=UPI002F95F6E7